MKRKNENLKLRLWILRGLFAALVVVAAILIFFDAGEKLKNDVVIEDAELARAMTYGTLEDSDFNTDSEFVKFGAFFLRDLDGDGYAERVKGTCKALGETDTLYMSLNVLTEGVLKDGKISINGENFYFQTAIVNDDVISGNYVGNNTSLINLNDVNVGTQKLIFGHVRSGNYGSWNDITNAIGKNFSKYSRVNTITLTGTFVDNNGDEIEINKVVELPVDWYSDVVAEIPDKYNGNTRNKYQSYERNKIVDEDNNQIVVNYSLAMQETNNRLLLAKAVIEGTIPDFNGYDPVSVVISGNNVEYEYDSETQQFRAWRNASYTEKGYVYEEANSGSYRTYRFNEFDVEVVYPIEAYTIEELIPEYRVVYSAYYEGFNNPNEEFDNPYISNVAEGFVLIDFPHGVSKDAQIAVKVGKYIASPYYAYVVSNENAKEIDSEYEVRWEFNAGSEDNIKLFEDSKYYGDYFEMMDGSLESMEDFSSVSGLYFGGVAAILGDENVLVYDNDSNELLVELTREDVEKYNSRENMYVLKDNVKHVRFEFSDINGDYYTSIMLVKTLDSEKLSERYSNDEFEKIEKVKSSARGEVYSQVEEKNKILSNVGEAIYSSLISIARINDINITYLSTQETTENVVINIDTMYNDYIYSEWINGTFLIKLPKEIIMASVNNVTCNNSDVDILGYDVYKDGENFFIRILTENIDPQSYRLSVSCNLTPDSRILSVENNVELYAYNEVCDRYLSNYSKVDIYDIDGDGLVDDKVSYSEYAMNFIGPSSLITTEIAKNYNEYDDVIVTTVAPQVVIIDKGFEDKTAKIVVDITNNYTGSVSDVVIVGKIPFEGNSTVINEYNLKSEYTAILTGALSVPDEIKDFVKVYYSYNENVNKNLNDTSNNWISEDVDYSRVKSYLVDFGDYILPIGANYGFEYEIRVPDDVNYNEISYSTHAVYFSLETDEGKYRDSTETNKLGFMIARMYDLEIENSRFNNNDTKISGTYFSISVDGEDDNKIAITDTDGKIYLSNLYVDKVYTVKEIRSSNDYVLNDNEFKFKVVVEDNKLKLQVLNDDVIDDIVLDTDGGKVSVFVENIPKYTLNGVKFEELSGDKISGVRFRVTGKGITKSGKVVNTNNEGKFSINSLYPNEEYTLVEEYAKGYDYDESKIKFVASYENGEFVFNVTEGNFNEVISVVENNVGQNDVDVNIVNRKLNDFELNITKYVADEEVTLADAVYNISGKWINYSYRTDENGMISNVNLFEEIEYTLREVSAPEGYAVSNDVIKFTVSRDDGGEIVVSGLKGNVKNYSFEEGILKIELEDEPLFKLIKKDGTSGGVIPNVKFAIYNVDDDGNELLAKDTDGNDVGEIETIDGKEYQIVETDENGVIKYDLAEGLYKVIEVETAEGYQFAENIEDRTYYFGIGKAKAAVTELIYQDEVSIENEGRIKYVSQCATEDGGFIVTGEFYGDLRISADLTAKGKEILIYDTAYYDCDGIVIKYNAAGKIEWVQQCYSTIYTYPKKIVETEDGYLVAASGKTVNIPAEATKANMAIRVNSRDYDYYVFKITKDGLIDWVVSTYADRADGLENMISTKDGGFVLIGNWRGKNLTIPANKVANGEDIILENDIETDNPRSTMILKYNSNHMIEWAKNISGGYGTNVLTEIENRNGDAEYLIGGTFEALRLTDEEATNTGFTNNINYTGLLRLSSEGDVINVVNKDDNFGFNQNVCILKYEEFYLVYYKTCVIKYDLNDTEIMRYNFNNLGIVANEIISDGNDGYYVSYNLNGRKIINAIDTVEGESININSTSNYGVLILHFSAEFKVDEYKVINNYNTTASLKMIQLQSGEFNVVCNLDGSVSVDGQVVTGASVFRFNDLASFKEVNHIGRTTVEFLDVLYIGDKEKIVVGKYNGIVRLNVAGEEKQYYSNGVNDGIIIKYDEDNNVEWVIPLGTGFEDEFNGIIEINGKYYISGFYGNPMEVPGEYTVDGSSYLLSNNTKSSTLNYNNAYYNGLVLVINDEGKIEDNLIVNCTSHMHVRGIQKYYDDEYVIWGEFSNEIILEDEFGVENTIKSTWGQDGYIIRLNSENKMISYQTVGMDDKQNITVKRLVVTPDDGFAVIGTYAGETLEFETKNGLEVLEQGWVNNYIVKYDSDFIPEWAYNCGGCNSDARVAVNEKGEVYVTGTIYFCTIVYPAEKTLEGKEITIRRKADAWYGYAIKFDLNGMVEWGKMYDSRNGYYFIPIALDDGLVAVSKEGITFRAGEMVGDSTISTLTTAMIRINDGGLAENVYLNAKIPYSNAKKHDDGSYVFVGNNNGGRVMKIYENVLESSYPEQQIVEVKNYKKTYEITTEVKELDDGSKGGVISGEDESPYEVVEWNEKSSKEIKIVPDSGYKIYKIWINDQEVSFSALDDGSYILPNIENVVEDKHIKVEFSNTVSEVVVHHYVDGTTDKVAEDDVLHGKIGNGYTSIPKVDLDGYELVAEKIPGNASGVYTIDVQEVIYYYGVKKVKLQVNYYLEGSTESVSDDAYEAELEKGSDYETKEAVNIDEKYELVGVPSNVKGIIDEDIVVNYYYRLKSFDISTLVDGYGGNISGNGQTSYENVKYGNDSIKEIVATPESGYHVDKILINGKNYEFELEADGSVVLDKFENVTEDKKVVVSFVRNTGKVIVHHYIENTTTPIADDVVKNGFTGDMFATTPSEEIPDEYEIAVIPEVSSGRYTDDDQEIIYYYKLKKFNYVVNYLEMDTNIVLSSAKTADAVDYGTIINSASEIIDIKGYEYKSVDKVSLTIGFENNVINIYYGKRDDLSYVVNYLDSTTNEKISDSKKVEKVTYQKIINSANEVVVFEKYDYVGVSTESIVIDADLSKNVINIYYKKKDTSVIVHYYIDGTEESLSNDVMIKGKVDDSYTTVSAGDIPEYYSLVSEPVNKSGIMTVSQIEVIYYYSLNSYPYVVNYLEQGSNKVLKAQKQGEKHLYGDSISSKAEVAEIEGYNYVSADKDTLIIGLSDNVINLYYVKRDDLSAEINYLERDSDTVLKDKLELNHLIFESVIDAEDYKEVIDGYKYDGVSDDSITVGTGKNVINIYYKKRDDLKYRVNYLEKGNNKVLAAEKVVENMTFKEEVDAKAEVIDINGYVYDSISSETITIGTGDNVINIYYTRQRGLAYSVNYVERESGNVLSMKKTVDGKIFEDVIDAADEVIDIEGYVYDGVSAETITIGTGVNELTIYYVKRDDLSYVINYLDKESGEAIINQKKAEKVIFETEVDGKAEIVDIYGYDFESIDKELLVVGVDDNVINIYYIKKDTSVLVKYLEKDTDKVLADEVEIEGKVFDKYKTDDEGKIDNKYEFIEVIGDTEGEMTEEQIEVIYYYGLKDSSVLVHHYIYGTEEKLADDELIEGKVDDNYSTSVSERIESKWELAVVPENRTGVMTVDQIEVTYYYRKKPAKVIVHYYEEGTVNKLSEDKVIEARVDDEYKTEIATDVPVKYEFSYVDGETVGNMTEEDIEIIYYYRVKDTDLVVRYLEMNTDEVLHEENRQTGKVDEDYITSSLEIDGYEVVAHSGNESGRLGLETTYVTYYYLYKTKASVEYIDKMTGEVLESRSEDGLEGDEFVTEAKNFDEYVLVEEPDEKSVRMTKEEQVLRYYYVHVAAGVVEKHIDVKSGEILYNEVHDGNEGDEYKIDAKTNEDEGFEDYDLVEDMLPENAEGEMTTEIIEVVYYYIKKAEVVVKYVDKNTGEELFDDVVIGGHEGDEYSSDEIEFEDYKLVAEPENAKGEMTKDQIEVVYYYVKKSAGVVEEHVDVISGEKIIDDVRHDGYEGDKYKVEAKTNEDEGFEKYQLVQDKLPENAEGEMSNEEIVVTYYYRKKSTVTIRYVDKNTGEEIEEPEVKDGLEDEEYTSNEKIVDGYELSKEPEDKNGKFGSDDKEIVYYYVRPAKVVVNYVDKDTEEELFESEVIDGYEGEEYHTEAKEVEYYKLDKEPENKDGKFEVYDTDDEDEKWIVVNYYYAKKEFNLNMDKKIVDILVNGTSVMNGDGEFAKVELNSKNLENSDVVVKYEIAVENDSEIAGSAILEENIPEGMKMVQSENEKWNVGAKNATLITEEIEPGEKKSYEVVMRWIAGGDSVGTISNIARIAKTENGAGFEEVTEKDNEDMADVVISIATGLGDENDYTIIYGMTLIGLVCLAAGTIVVMKRKV